MNESVVDFQFLIPLPHCMARNLLDASLPICHCGIWQWRADHRFDFPCHTFHVDQCSGVFVFWWRVPNWENLSKISHGLLPWDAMLSQYVLPLCVRLSVRLSHTLVLYQNGW